jgi:hypothetical protein
MKEKEIIDNYRDLPYGKYEEIVRLCEDEMTDVDRKVAVIAILTGKTEDEVLHLPLATFTRYSAASRFLESECPENLIPAVSKTYPIGGFVLVPVTDMRKVTAAQYIDFQTFAEDRDHRAVEMLSCFLIPRGCDYNEGYDVLDVHRAIRDELSVADVLALLAFFFGSWLKSIRGTLTSSMKAARRIKDPAKREAVMTEIRARLDSLTAGDGWPTSTE